jgi:putative ABC transport system permease protein
MAGYSARYLQVNKLLGSSRALALVYFFYEGSIVLMASVFISVLSIIPINALIVNRYGLHLLENNLGFVSLLIFAYFILSLGFGMLPVLKNSFVSIGIQDKKQGQIRLGKGGINRGLIVFQYAFSIALIISVIVISRQTNYALKESLGVQENNIVVLEKVHANVQQKFSLFKHELSKYNSIESVSAMFEPPGGEANDMFPFELEGFEAQDGDNNNIGVFPCDYAFAEVFGLEFLGGDNFSANNKDNDGLGEFIINEAALKRLQFQSAQEAIGKSFKLMFSVPNTDITIPGGKIIGVVKDFHLSSLKKEVEPLVLFKRDKMWLINFVISFKPGMQENAIADANTVWSNMFPEYPFQYAHVDGLYKEVYKAELLQARLLSIFTVIALFICSLGLFGLALIITQNRMKEIGVRKVNGARVVEILSMLNLDFMKWVLLAFVLACPVAWYAMKLWLQNFAYKTPLSWWIFALSGFIALSIVLITVSVQCWKAATQNPVEALRYE